jgi:flagellar basal-body rod modification protein FlgD
MAVIDPTSGSGGSSNKTNEPTAQRATGLDRNAFLQLLVTQMSHQNPLSPQADREFIAQLAQFSSLEQLTNLNSTLSSVATALGVPANDTKK